MKPVIQFFAAILFASLAVAQELPLQHPDDILKNAYPGKPNTRVVELKDMPKVVSDTFATVELAFEMGDGYYDTLASAYYEVKDSNGAIVGYLEAALLRYTEDPDVPLVGAMVNLHGRRLDSAPVELDSFPNIDDSAILDLPAELHPR